MNALLPDTCLLRGRRVLIRKLRASVIMASNPAQPCDPTAAMRAGSWVHAAAAPPHQAFTSDPAGVSDAGAAHIGRHRKADNTTVGDCTHWCSPGPLEAYMLPMLQAYLARRKPSKERGARTRGASGRR